jgi:hypothetical protein
MRKRYQTLSGNFVHCQGLGFVVVSLTGFNTIGDPSNPLTVILTV